MAAPVAGTITLPLDTGNSGSKIRTQTRSVSGNTVHEHFYVPTTEYQFVSKGFFSSAQQTVLAAAQNGTTTGFFWLWNPVASTITVAIRSITADANAGSALATPTAPVISFNKFTATGTASGGTATIVKWSSSATTLQASVLTAMTGLTISLVGDVGSFSIPSALTAVGAFYAQKQVRQKSPLGFQRGNDLELGPGEGLVVYQSTAGTTSDTRKFTVAFEWIEVDVS